LEKALGRRELRVFETPARLAEAAASEFLRASTEAIARSGRFTVALSGGSTPKAAYEQIANASDRFDWGRVHVFWSDERYVSLDDRESNFRMAKEALLTRTWIPPENVHPWETYRKAGEAADAYENRLALFFGEATPRFDWIFLGVGADGHTASLFPGTAALTETKRPVAANFVKDLDSWRLTLTFPTLDAARECVFLAQGSEKAEIVARVFAQDGDLPAARVSAGRTIWMVDRAAASASTTSAVP
jgi:6-phosphogluconolactonase